ncbi:MAG: LCP family protein [Oscillospiraceae bacterium]|nr:LCP family protein [Oscillospiraceae bacterium]
MDRKKRIKPTLMIAGGAAALALGALSLYMLWEKPPETAPQTKVQAQTAQAAPAEKRRAATPEPDRGTAFDTSRQDGVYTVLIAGSDDGTGNTDVIMVGRLDTVEHTADVVSIPRDTLINVDTPIRKLNSVYWGAVYNGGVGSDALRRHVKKLTGFDVDCYAILDLDAFERVVDALGGVWFDVPQRMYYDQGPVIDLEPGWQLLNGEQAMWLCRYRSSYVNGDLDRIEVQHDFLKAAADQFLQLGSIPNIPQVAQILAESTDTNMTAANLAWFARQLLRCKSEDIRFYTAPNTPAYVNDISYTFLDLYNWLEMINTRLNPTSTPIGEGQLDLVYLHNGAVSCTTALQGISYFQLGRRQEAQEPEPQPASIPDEVYIPPQPRPRVRTAPPADEWFLPAEPEDAAPPVQEAPAPEPVQLDAPAEPASTWPPFLSPTDDDWLSEM